MSLMSRLLLAGALAALASPALGLLPNQVQKEIEETRASFREQGVRADAIYDDAGVTRFTLPGGTDAVMVNDGEVCGGERIKGANPTCAKSTPGNRQINRLAEKSALHFW